MHILEDHVIPWLRQWHMGAGLRGEQGAESIHTHISKLETQYHSIINTLDWLKYIVEEYTCNIESTPGLNSL